MARYISDQNKVLGMFESGTYGNNWAGSSFWIGQVTENSIEHNENKIQSRYLGTANRSYDTYDDGPRDITGTITYNPQDMRLVFWAIGSVYDVSGTTSIHYASEINNDVRQSAFTSGTLNPPISFTIEDSKQSTGTGANFIRIIKGIVPKNVSLNLAQGEKAEVSYEYIGQSDTFSSGATTSVTERTNMPYLWNHTQLQIGGSVVDTAKSISLGINQNTEAPHYLNGSREVSTPFMLNRDYTLSVTIDLNNPESKKFYETYYTGGSQFNAQLDLNADNTGGSTGSQHTRLIMSGCELISMDIPSPSDGINESTLEIVPKNITATEWASSSISGLFNPY